MTKVQLRSYRHIKIEKDNLDRTIKELEEVIYSPRIAQNDGQPHGSSSSGSIVERAAIKHAELLERYQRKTIELAAAMLAIEEAIEVLDPTERMLMRLYYIDGLTWEEVSYEINYSWRQVHRIHRRALEKLQSI